jgi:hypothetical protein
MRMAADKKTEADNPVTRVVPAASTGSRGDKLIPCPYAVIVDGRVRDQFYDVRDAVAAARSTHRENPVSTVIVTDTRTGKLKIEID